MRSKVKFTRVISILRWSTPQVVTISVGGRKRGGWVRGEGGKRASTGDGEEAGYVSIDNNNNGK